VLLDTIDNIESMFSVEPASDIDKQLLQEVLRKLSEVKSELMRALENQELQVTEASFTFHDSYYKLRTLVQYAARLIDNSNRVSFHEMNCQIGKREGSLALATNSGMAATRNVLMHLVGGSKVLPPAIRFYTAGNYWETEFLFENMDRNPHYNNLNDLSKKSRMTKFEANSPKEKIESYVEAVLEDNVNGAQMLCLDKSIAPFFYTETFDLLHFTKVLDKNKDRIHHPIYLVVDNTLDFDKITVNTLFPNGVPKNVFLIFTASMAKMHQLGLDTATGGVINIYSSVEDKPKAEALHAELEVKITSEGTAQTGYNRYLLDMLFFRRYDEGTMDKYLDYMVRKRQRNTEFFINGLELGLRDSLVGDSSKVGMYHYQSPLTGARKLQIRDDKDQTVMHEVDFSFHHDPESNIHAYFTMIENAANNHVAGRVFEEIKRRVFERAALRGIHLADGTSWGFPITRLDWYMHTMRIAMGLQHEQTMHSLGIIMSGVLNELFISPQDFLQRAEIMSLRGDVLEKRADELLELDRLIPHDPNNPTPISYYNEPRDGAIDFSFYVRKGDKMVGFVYAYATEENGEKFVYLSKAAVSAEHREDRYFRRMLMNLWINARQMGYKKILLQTSASSKNEGVIKAYERCGFKVARLVTEMQEDGWPLIMVEMEADVEGSPYEQMEHFPSIPNEVYEQIHDSGNLTLIDTYKPK
jgi:ribosomal protein S18 acetylase RimI-like enzyme